MAGVFNLFDGEVEPGPFAERPGFGWRNASVGGQLGAKLLGMTLYELETGQRTFPYHYHLGMEEWLFVLAGRPTLRGPDGERTLEPGDVVVFAEGPDGAHQVRNDGEEQARVAILSTKPPLAAGVYPDSGKVGILGAGASFLVASEPQLDYWAGED